VVLKFYKEVCFLIGQTNLILIYLVDLVIFREENKSWSSSFHTFLQPRIKTCVQIFRTAICSHITLNLYSYLRVKDKFQTKFETVIWSTYTLVASDWRLKNRRFRHEWEQTFLENYVHPASHNCWVFGLCPSSHILKTGGHSVWETGSLFVFRWGGDTLLGALESAMHNDLTRLTLSKAPNRVGVSPPSPEDRNSPSYRNAVLFRIPDDEQSPKNQ
jgi:hypothetical protein